MTYGEKSGRIFDIQRFSVHDGPGIRTIIFFKGCMFRCRWCCNPEGQHFDFEEMKVGEKNKNIGREITAAEAVELAARDEAYYRRSGGGITLSGGEFLLQPDFAEAVLYKAKERGINTAVETTGFADYKTIERLLPLIDYFLMDIKHINSEKHKEFCGCGNERILENAFKISQNANSYSVRVPVIPTFNATTEEIGDIAKFAASLPKVSKMHLLPYHRLGRDKYDNLGREYSLTDIMPPDEGKMAELLREAKKYFENTVIGG